MDSTAVNYDPLATIDTRGWCVAPREGCMMPPDYPGVFGRNHTRQRLATNPDPLATVHVPSARQVW